MLQYRGLIRRQIKKCRTLAFSQNRSSWHGDAPLLFSSLSGTKPAPAKSRACQTKIRGGVQLGQRAAIDAGVSTSDQSCERPVADLTDFAARGGYEVVGLFKETASGTKANRMTRLRKILLFCAMSALALLLAACAFYKPLRVLTPETFGLTCITDDICVEDTSTITEAAKLRDDALSFVTANVGPIERPPRVLFCNSEDCFSRFGNPAVAALNFSGLDTLLINDRGWQDYILRHELIHHWQVEQFGVVQASRLPRWYIEGMAYSISQDPRDPLPRSDIQAWRDQFNAWVEEGNDWRQPPQQ